MNDPRIDNLANILVNYSTKVQPGEWVGVLGDVAALPLVRAVFAKVVEAGGNPSLMLTDETLTREFARQANDDQMVWLDPALSLYYDKADVYIRCTAFPNTRAMTNVDPKRLQKIQTARAGWLATRMRRAAEGQMKWVGTMFPTEGSAQEAGMSLEEYEAFVFGATFADKADPVGEWKKLGDMQQKKIDWLKGKKHVELKGPNVEMDLSIDGRVFINACGERNMPDGEIFTGPVEESVNGWYRASYPVDCAGAGGREHRTQVPGWQGHQRAGGQERGIAVLDDRRRRPFALSGRVRHRHELRHQSLHGQHPVRREDRRDGAYRARRGLSRYGQQE